VIDAFREAAGRPREPAGTAVTVKSAVAMACPATAQAVPLPLRVSVSPFAAVSVAVSMKFVSTPPPSHGVDVI
jgi:hypothetical protein